MIKSPVIIIGAGAAGLFCAGLLSQNKINCIVLEKNKTPGKKIIISGGGRCNFTNLTLEKHHFQGSSKNFHWNILKSYPNIEFINLVKKYKIQYYEKKLGQLFCQNSSKDILELLIKEIDPQFVDFRYSSEVENISKTTENFLTFTKDKTFSSKYCIISSGGLPMPAIGGTNFGTQMARKFSIDVAPEREALVPMKNSSYESLSGTSLLASIKISKKNIIKDDLLFTHKGLSGPLILKASLYYEKGETLFINLLPNENLPEILNENLKKTLSNTLAIAFPKKFVSYILEHTKVRNIQNCELSKKETNILEDFIHRHKFTYKENEGYRKAEVMKGGVMVSGLTRNLESRKVENLYFIGETVDVPGLLGGYNFQWAWSSAYNCAQSIIAKNHS